MKIQNLVVNHESQPVKLNPVSQYMTECKRDQTGDKVTYYKMCNEN